MSLKGMTFGKKTDKNKKFKSAKGNELSISDKNFIKNNFEKFSITVIANRVGKSVEIIEKFLKQNDLIQSDKEEVVEEVKPIKIKQQVVAKPEPKPEFTSVDIFKRRQFVTDNCKSLSLAEMADAQGVSRDTILRDLKILGLSARKTRISTNTESIDFVKGNYRVMTNQEMADHLGVDQNEIRRICSAFKLIRTKEETEAIRARWGKKYMTPEQEAYIFENYGNLSINELSVSLGITRGQLIKFAREKKLRVSKEQFSILNVRYPKKDSQPRVVVPNEQIIERRVYVTKNYLTMSALEMAEKCNTSRDTILRDLKILGLSKKQRKATLKEE